MKKLILSAFMLTGVMAFAQDEPAKQTEKKEQPAKSAQANEAPAQGEKQQVKEKPTTATTRQPATAVKEEKGVEKKAEPAKKAN